jgi:alkanesulfonate monooxygenase SsuD/methylene tetrahydromethanopterin reductase-like flavin-dependent oxidoreductase (luciferase family)
MFTLRFDMLAPVDGASTSDLYQAAIDMAAWGEEHGCLSALISEHHTSPDGYIPSPLILASAIAARTKQLPIVVGALLLNFYDPIKLAEDMIVLDIVSRGRVSHVIGLGYRPEEYAMFGIPMSERGRVIEQKVIALQRALRGEQFDYEGRAVKVTPPAFTPGGPRLAYGGHSLAAARRAGRLGLDMFAEGSIDGLLESYQQAARDAGREPGMALIPDRVTPTSVFVAEDLDDAWDKIGPHMLYDATIYRSWMGDFMGASSRSESTTIAQMRAENGAYRILTPDQAIAQIKSGIPLLLHPLCGGTPPELAWETLRLVGERIMLALKQ